MNLPEERARAHTLFADSIPIYKNLIHNPLYKSYAKLALGEIYRIMHRPAEAAALYIEVSEENKNPKTLFHAATLLLQYDKAKAAAIFKEFSP